jgi:hypothetical protein
MARAALAALSEVDRRAMPPSPVTVVAIAHRLGLAAHAEIERAVRRVREEGQDWAAVAPLLGLDALPCHVDDPARLAFDYCAGLARPPEFDQPGSYGICPACGHTIADHQPRQQRAGGTRTDAST